MGAAIVGVVNNLLRSSVFASFFQDEIGKTPEIQ
jgi:hypothetical protein